MRLSLLVQRGYMCLAERFKWALSVTQPCENRSRFMHTPFNNAGIIRKRTASLLHRQHQWQRGLVLNALLLTRFTCQKKTTEQPRNVFVPAWTQPLPKEAGASRSCLVKPLKSHSGSLCATLLQDLSLLESCWLLTGLILLWEGSKYPW